MRKLLVLFSFLSLSATAQTQFRYTCPGGETFEAQYQEGRALLGMKGKLPIVLFQTLAASGVRYSDGYTTLWTKGNDARIESGSVNVKDCKGASSVEPVNSLSGMFVYLADSSTFTECETKLRFPVAQEQDYITVERVYTRQRIGRGQSLFVTLQGHIENRPGVPPTLIVEKYISADPGKRCDAATLEGKWTLTRLNGEDVQLQRPAQIEFLKEGNRVAGFSGCNRFGGAFQQNASSLQFGMMVSTKMACLGPGMEVETRFLSTLEKVKTYRISATELTLLGTAGEPVAHLRRE